MRREEQKHNPIELRSSMVVRRFACMFVARLEKEEEGEEEEEEEEEEEGE